MDKGRRDFLPKNRTKKEIDYEYEKAELIKQYELRLLNLTTQLRAVMISAGITPEQFLTAFRDHRKQNEFFMELHKLEEEAEKQYEEQKKTAKENDIKLAEQFKIPEPDEAAIKEMIQGEGDQII